MHGKLDTRLVIWIKWMAKYSRILCELHYCLAEASRLASIGLFLHFRSVVEKEEANRYRPYPRVGHSDKGQPRSVAALNNELQCNIQCLFSVSSRFWRVHRMGAMN